MERTNTGRPDDPLIGRVLDERYRIESRIARGGMATVYRANDQRLGRTVAVKVLHPELSGDPEFVRRFEREARSAARLSHPNLVSLFDQGVDHGTFFLVLEYVPGVTLRDVIRREAPMPPARALEILEPVLGALAAAHRETLVHRDIKPENILIGDDGTIKVGDFGLTRAIGSDTQHTAVGGSVMGTVSYMAPELVAEEQADQRADVYACGVILYEMLTGRKPHQADQPVQVAYKHVHEDVPAPSLSVPGIPPYVDALVARATARDKDQRAADARVLQHHVNRVRSAIAQGLQDDPELVADLMPRPAHTPGTNTAELPAPEDVYDHTLEPVPVTGGGTRGPGAPSESPLVPDADPDREPTEVVVTPLPVEAVPVGRPPINQPPITAYPTEPSTPPTPTAEPEPAPRRSRRGLFLLLLVLLLALAGGGYGWYLGVGRYTVTPGVLNLPEAAAKEKVADAGLKYQAGKAMFSEDVAKGSVIQTQPTAGARILKEGTVTVVLSLGPERYNVPVVRGKTVDEATQILQKGSLSLGKVSEEYNEKVPAGQIVKSDPAKGTPLKRDSAVNVVVSLGREPIPIPNWTGKSADRATTRLTKLTFKVSTTEAYSDTVPAGQVIAQNPNSGTGFKGDVVTLEVSKGPELIKVPGVRGKRLADAKAELEKLGFKVVSEHTMFYFGADMVVSSNPGAGTSVRKGSTITLGIV